MFSLIYQTRSDIIPIHMGTHIVFVNKERGEIFLAGTIQDPARSLEHGITDIGIATIIEDTPNGDLKLTENGSVLYGEDIGSPDIEFVQYVSKASPISRNERQLR